MVKKSNLSAAGPHVISMMTAPALAAMLPNLIYTKITALRGRSFVKYAPRHSHPKIIAFQRPTL